MDPDETFSDILKALVFLWMDRMDKRNREAAITGLRNLANWLDRDGFAPDVGKAIKKTNLFNS